MTWSDVVSEARLACDRERRLDFARILKGDPDLWSGAWRARQTAGGADDSSEPDSRQSDARKSPTGALKADAIFDATTDEYKGNYRAGVAGESMPSGAEEVLQLVVEACRWGDANGNPWPLSRYPQYTRVHQFGEQINRAGGRTAMQRVAAFVDARTRKVSGSNTILNNMWDGIGGWLA
jgi:hypothetical protein